jgi:hypothetical protein
MRVGYTLSHWEKSLVQILCRCTSTGTHFPLDAGGSISLRKRPLIVVFIVDATPVVTTSPQPVVPHPRFLIEFLWAIPNLRGTKTEIRTKSEYTGRLCNPLDRVLESTYDMLGSTSQCIWIEVRQRLFEVPGLDNRYTTYSFACCKNWSSRSFHFHWHPTLFHANACFLQPAMKMKSLELKLHSQTSPSHSKMRREP